MKDEIKIKLSQLVSNTKSELFGIQTKLELEKTEDYKNLITYFLEFLKDFYNCQENDKELYQIGQKICESILIIYRDSKLKNTKIAESLFMSLFEEFPKTTNTNLFDRYRTLLESSASFKKGISTNDRILLWSILKTHFESYNEFLGGLLGFINVSSKVILGKNYNPDVLNNTYKAKIDEFKSLKLDYLFPIFTNLAKPEIRNAISHSSISINNNNDEILYSFKKGKEVIEKKISLIEFIGIASAGIYLPIGYISAIIAIYVVEYGNSTDFVLLPDNIREIFHNNNRLSKN